MIIKPSEIRLGTNKRSQSSDPMKIIMMNMMKSRDLRKIEKEVTTTIGLSQKLHTTSKYHSIEEFRLEIIESREPIKYHHIYTELKFHLRLLL